MQTAIDLKESNVFSDIYSGNTGYNLERFDALSEKFNSEFGTNPPHFFSTPGRVEISGNHTDHNHGKVIAGSINLDSIAAVNQTATDKIKVFSDGYKQSFEVDIKELDVVIGEAGSTTSLIRGVLAGFKSKGYSIGGFNACLASDVLVGSGLSSSASIEVMLGTILNTLFNNSEIPFDKLAIIGQYAENRYFGKPCGLMDQVACAAGGIVTIDFADPDSPLIEKLDIDFCESGYSLVIVDTGGNHADLTPDYSAIPAEMKAVAALLGKSVLRDCNETEFYSSISEIRKKLGDRAVLRAIHFFEENKRVDRQVALMKSGDFAGFLELVNESGNSSFKFLQNIFSPQSIREQGVSLALAISSKLIEQFGEGACRINGGGFAGTIEAFIPAEYVGVYSKKLVEIFGSNSVKVLNIRNTGTICING